MQKQRKANDREAKKLVQKYPDAAPNGIEERDMAETFRPRGRLAPRQRRLIGFGPKNIGLLLSEYHESNRRENHADYARTLQGMFPDLDREVISDVVRQKEGRVGMAVDACLALSHG